jgi:hypothetical protein
MQSLLRALCLILKESYALDFGQIGLSCAAPRMLQRSTTRSDATQQAHRRCVRLLQPAPTYPVPQPPT